jgi:L-alanine-DL-glutamate epimerase-like enolase superfamily enzyme
MHVVDYKCHLVETPTGIELSTSYGAPPPTRRHVVVELMTDEGVTGWGEASPLSWFTGETPETVAEILQSHWLPLLKGEDPFHIPKIHAILGKEMAANSSARAAIDVALHDICARVAGVPLYKYLGGHGAESLARTYALGISDIGVAVEQAKEWVGRGYGTLKMKIGGGPQRDVERVAAVRDAVGPDVNIRVDANNGYDLKNARQVILGLEPYDIEMVEQPLPTWDYDGWSELRRSVDVPLMADESLHSPHSALDLVKRRCVDYVVVKLIKTGGIYRAKQVAAICAAADVECIVSTPFDTEIGGAAALHVAFSIGSQEHSHDLPPMHVETAHSKGRIHPPQGPGLGTEGLSEVEVSWALETAN